MSDIRRMELGQILDYCQEWNAQHDPDGAGSKNKKENNTEKRFMSQAEINAFLG